MSKTIVVTGVSSGIGNDLANQLIAANHTVIGISRRQAKDLNYDHFSCDLSNAQAIEETAHKINQKYPTIDAVIHVAGMGIADALEHTNYADAEWIYKVNVLAPFYLNRFLIPNLRQNRNTKIIHVGSLAGTLTIPFQAFYSMSKAALFSYSEALRMELKPFAIHVSIILPGDIKTPFTDHRKNTYQKDDPIYQGRIDRAIQKMAHDEQQGMSASAVTKVILKQLNKRKTPIFETVGLKYKVILMLAKFLPHAIREKIIYHFYAK